MTTRAVEPPAKAPRRWDIDWLRFIAVLLLFPFHTARIFDIFEEFYVKSEVLSMGLTFLIGFLGGWHMPLFFLLAGASTWFALRFRSGRQYAGERVKRLLVPFVFGVLVLIPPQSYLGLLSHSGYAGPFFEWYPRFFNLIPEDMDGYFLGGHTWGHLWFIFHLLVYSIVALPLFLFLNRQAGQRLVDRLARFSTKPGVIFLPAVLLLLTLGFPDIAGGNPLFYIFIFIFGYILMADARFSEAIDRHKAVALILGPVVALAVLLLYGAGWVQSLPGWAASATGDYYDAFVPWFSLVALMGYGRQFLNFSNSLLKYTAEASYPIYTLHQTVIVVIGFFTLQWNVGVALQFLTIMIVSLVVTVLVYDLLVKRINPVRFLFGLKPRKKPQAVPVVRPEGTAA